MREIWATILYWRICGICNVEYILNGQGTGKVYGKTKKIGAKSRRNERGIQYPVASRWTKELEKSKRLRVVIVLYLHASKPWIQVIDGSLGCLLHTDRISPSDVAYRI